MAIGLNARLDIGLGDFDGDGDIDFIGPEASGPSSLYLNNGAGVFSSLIPTAIIGFAKDLEVGDVDGDGDLDVVAMGSSTQPVYLNDGSANFTQFNNSPAIGFGLGAALGDLDADGDLDLFQGRGGFASQGATPDKVWLNGVAVSNQPPVAAAGIDQSICTSTGSAEVTLDGSGSSDPDSDPLTYTWREASTIIAGPTSSPTSPVTLSVGSHTIELTVDDGTDTDTDEVIVTVNENPAVTFNPAGPFFVYEPTVDLSTFVSPAGGTFSGVGISGDDFDPSVAGVGTHTITYSFTDEHGCSDTADQDITVTLPPLSHPFVLLADKEVKVDGQVSSDGDIHSNDKIDLQKGNPSTHTGNLTAVDEIKIDKDNTIDGDVTAGGKVDLKDNAIVTGTVIEHGSVVPELLPTLAFSAGGADVKVDKNQTQSLTPGSYGKVHVKKRGTLQLSHDGTGGDYFFDELDLKEETILSINVSNGPVTINTVNKLHFHKNSAVEINSPYGSESRFVTFTSLKDVDVQEDGRVFGSIIAPDAKVHLKKNVSFQGSICAEKVDIDKEATFLHHDSGGILAAPPLLVGVPDVQVAIEKQKVEATTPTKSELSQNYPNPFNPETWIPYRLAKAASVTLTIYDIQGTIVRRIQVGHQQPATYVSRDKAIYFDGRNNNGEHVASGVYFYRLQAGDYTATKKMVILK